VVLGELKGGGGGRLSSVFRFTRGLCCVWLAVGMVLSRGVGRLAREGGWLVWMLLVVGLLVGVS